MIHALGGCQTRASEERSLYAGEVVGSIPTARTIENRNNEHFSAPLQKHHTAIEAFRTLPTPPCGIKIEGSSHAVAAAPTVMEVFLERTVRQSNTSVKGAHRWQSASSTSAS